MKFIKQYVLILVIIITQFLTATAQEFGRYGDCTTGRGICSFSPENIGEKSVSSNPKFSLIAETETTILLKIYKPNITPDEEMKLFGKAVKDFLPDEKMYFIMDADLPLDAKTISSLKLLPKFQKIPAGSYLVTSFTAFYIAEIKL